MRQGRDRTQRIAGLLADIYAFGEKGKGTANNKETNYKENKRNKKKKGNRVSEMLVSKDKHPLSTERNKTSLAKP